MDGKYVFGAIVVMCLTALGCVAIHYGVDGTLYLTIVGIIGGVVTVIVGRQVYNVLVKKDAGT